MLGQNFFVFLFFTKNLFCPKYFWPKLFLTKIFLTIKRDPGGNFIILWAASATFESSLLLDVTSKNRTNWDWVVPSSVKADSNWKSCKKENWGWKKSLVGKIFLVEKFYGSKTFFGWKFFLSGKIFFGQKKFRLKFFLSKKFFG